jgi:hypothetical protein
MTEGKRCIRIRKKSEHKVASNDVALPGLLDLRGETCEDELATESRERASEIIRKIALAETLAEAEQFTHEFIQWAGQ